MNDPFKEILDTLILAALAAGVALIGFRLLLGSFKGREETQRILRERRFYLPVALGSCLLMYWVVWSMFHLRSVSVPFFGALFITAAMAPVFRVLTRTTWKGAFLLLYSFVVVNLLVFIAVFVLFAGAGFGR